jgi:hypothetical protein
VWCLFLKKKRGGNKIKIINNLMGGGIVGGLLVDNRLFVVFVFIQGCGGGEVSGGGTHYM